MLDLTKERDIHIDQRLRTNVIAWLNTVRPDGRPHTVALWFLWDGQHILIFSKPKQQKIRNIRQHGQVTLALDDTKIGEDAVVVEGTAELLHDPDMSAVLAAYNEKYGALIKSYGWSLDSLMAEYSQGIRITPTKFMLAQ